MKLMFLGFISMIVLLNAYVCVKYTAAVTALGVPAWLFRAFYALLVVSFFASIFFQDALLAYPLLNQTVTYALTLYLGIFIFSLVGFFIADIAALAIKILRVKPAFFSNVLMRSAVIFCAALLVTCYGMWNARQFHIKEYEISIDKQMPQPSLDFVLLSDLHLGTVIEEPELRTIVERVNALSPDAVVIAGDLFDHATDQRLHKAASSILSGLKAPLGVYYVYGNHEYYLGDERKAVQGLIDEGIRLLDDKTLMIGDAFYIVGRKDATDTNRLPLRELLEGLDRSKPLVLLDHQPRDLKEAQALGVDLMMSGHTHAGQIWPFGILTGMFNEMLYGLRESGGFHAVVTAGTGGWRYPIRVGSKNEIVLIRLDFKR